MANVLLITNDTSHEAYTRTQAALETYGHTVVGVADNALGNVPSDVDVIATVRALPANYGSWIAARWAEGYPILLGGPEAGKAAGETTHVARDLGILSDFRLISSTNSGTDDIDVLEAHPTTNMTPPGTVTITTYNNYVGMGATVPEGPGRKTAKYLTWASIVAIESGDALVSGVAPAKAVFMSFFYAGQTDYTAAGRDMIGSTVEWLTPEKPEPTGAVRIWSVPL